MIVFSPTAPVTARLAATVEHAPLLDLPSALAALRRDHGVATLLCEGGPTLFGALLEQQLVDELFLTLAPALVGGSEPRSSPKRRVRQWTPSHCRKHRTQLELAGVLERDGTLFLRYRF